MITTESTQVLDNWNLTFLQPKQKIKGLHANKDQNRGNINLRVTSATIYYTKIRFYGPFMRRGMDAVRTCMYAVLYKLVIGM